MKLYIDIDGVLLTTKNTQRPQYAIEFIDYITSIFDCYWLTSHCKEGNTVHLLQYLSSYYSKTTIEKLRTIKPTSWGTAKTEAIDFDSDFYWLDDYIFNFEKKVLEKYHKLENWIEVNLNESEELKHIKKNIGGKDKVIESYFHDYTRKNVLFLLKFSVITAKTFIFASKIRL